MRARCIEQYRECVLDEGVADWFDAPFCFGCLQTVVAARVLVETRARACTTRAPIGLCDEFTSNSPTRETLGVMQVRER
jgi:hypothetical protein